MAKRKKVGTLYFPIIKEDGKEKFDLLTTEFNWYVDLTESETEILRHYLNGIQNLLLSSLERAEQEQEVEQQEEQEGEQE